ncbi:DNA polymerase III subunit gamma and tau [Micrococcoides hystricis]|uniref:DNA-directed DNA polymerase n=1 Tax=Micrococcoides hystricis TaxID=1572761 RepID=A0ABV6PAQ7_9MICC
MSTALYRRYRPDTFADLIGQEHVTEPLMAALTKNRVNHAYLFSGPRGCGKTTSARILARCLNCHEGPTATPCGTCPSCVDLATGGQGSLDVVEIDAASHGGVDDARDLRERATFAPARDRYKIFIIDEAHMVTNQGSNALLKIVEEPPPHLKFIFATTEPDKVIGTIRSRTHHYPFRLVPPETLHNYLEELTFQEGMQAEPGVLSLVIRAGGGSVRDTLSVLDQLMAGAASQSLDYDRAVDLLGFTHAALLDDVVDALAAQDSATLFRMVDHVVQVGQDPRRFVEDLLERFRDLIIIRAVPDHPGQVLRGIPQDVLARMEVQAHNLGPAQLSLAADITNATLTAMVGATSPRLQLELLMARLMLPAAEVTQQSLAARLDRIEAHLAGSSAVDFTPAEASTPAPAADSAQSSASPTSSGDAPRSAAEVRAMLAKKKQDAEPAETSQAQERKIAAAPESVPAAEPTPVKAAQPAEQQPEQTAQPEPTTVAAEVESKPAPAAPEPAEITTPASEQAEQPAQQPADAPEAPEQKPQEEEQPAAAAPAQSTNMVEKARRLWPEIVQELSQHSRMLWMVAKDHTSVAGFDGQHLVVNFANDGARNTFSSRGGEQLLVELGTKHLGVACTVDLISGGGDVPGPKVAEPARRGGGLPAAAPSSPSKAASEPSGLGPEPDWSKPEPPVSWDDDSETEATPQEQPGGGDDTSDDTQVDEPSVQDAPEELGEADRDAEPEISHPQVEVLNDLPVPSFARKTGSSTQTRPDQAESDEADRSSAQQHAADSGNQTDTPQYPEDPYAGVPHDDARYEEPPQQDDAYSVDPYPSDPHWSEEDPSSTAEPADEAVVPAFLRRETSASDQEPAGSQTQPAEAATAQPAAPQRISRWQQMMAAQQAEQRQAEPEPEPTPSAYVEDIPSDDDEEIEASATHGRAALEKILGARLIEERRPGQDPAGY